VEKGNFRVKHFAQEHSTMSFGQGPNLIWSSPLTMRSPAQFTVTGPQFTVTVHIKKTYFPNEKESKADDGSAEEEKEEEIKKLSSELRNDYFTCKKTRKAEKCKV